MAAPHATGTIALMLSSKTSLHRRLRAVLDLLNLTAIDRPDDSCGTPDPSDNDPNFVYGEGRIDAKAAVDLAKEGGTLAGTVSDAATGDPIPGAHVTANNGEREFNATTDGAGNYSLFLAAGTYSVSASAFGYAETLVTDVVIRPTRRRTRTSSSRPCRGSRCPATSPAPRTVPRSRAPPSGPSARPCRRRPRTPPASTASSSRSATTRSARARAGARRSRPSTSASSRTSPRTSRCSASSMTSATAAARSRSTGSTRAGQTALYGDEFAGRLRLPFDFEFYGETYSQVWLSENGYMNFLEPGRSTFFPSGIPSASPPNAGIYPLWQDFEIDEEPRSTRRSSARARTGRSSSSTQQRQGLRCQPARDLRGQALGERHHRHALRRQRREPGRRPKRGHRHRERGRHRRPPVLVVRGSPRPEHRLPL